MISSIRSRYPFVHTGCGASRRRVAYGVVCMASEIMQYTYFKKLLRAVITFAHHWHTYTTM